jgi:hypothetical protein
MSPVTYRAVQNSITILFHISKYYYSITTACPIHPLTIVPNIYIFLLQSGVGPIILSSLGIKYYYSWETTDQEYIIIIIAVGTINKNKI